MRIIIIITSIIAIVFSSCRRIEGEGAIVVRQIDIETFNQIETACAFNVYIEYGTEFKVEAEGEQNIIDLLRTKVTDNKWYIELKNGTYTNYTLDLYITMPYITTITNSGSGHVFIANFSQDNIKLTVGGSGNVICTESITINNLIELDNSGSGNIEINQLSCNQSTTNIGGSGAVSIVGNSLKSEITSSGSGLFSGFDFTADYCEIKSEGSGNCRVFVNDELGILITGSGNVYYRGYPNVLSIVNGSGEVINSN